MCLTNNALSTCSFFCSALQQNCHFFATRGQHINTSLALTTPLAEHNSLSLKVSKGKLNHKGIIRPSFIKHISLSLEMLNTTLSQMLSARHHKLL